MMSVLPVQLSAALLGAMPTRFSGEPEDWPVWKRRWLQFLENVEEAMPSITDAQMLTIFKGLLDEASVDKLEAEQMLDPTKNFWPYWTWSSVVTMSPAYAPSGTA